MRVLVACECSGVVRDAFLARGHDAFSCDLKPCEFPSDRHIQGDCFAAYNFLKPDLVIAHPPCTFLTKCGASLLYSKKNGICQGRYEKGVLAARFFMRILDLDCRLLAVENPTPLKIFGLPSPSDVVSPHFFGASYQKRTCLWLKGLPPLIHTFICVNPISFESSDLSKGSGDNRKTNRSRTFPGLASAMAEQWG